MSEREFDLLDTSEFDVGVPRGFTRWTGGECPVEPDRYVVVYKRWPGYGLIGGGGTVPLLSATWQHTGGDDDIIAYSVLDENPDAELAGQEMSFEQCQARRFGDRLRKASETAPTVDYANIGDVIEGKRSALHALDGELFLQVEGRLFRIANAPSAEKSA